MTNNRRIRWTVLLVASISGCADNLSTHITPETPTPETSRATITGHVVDATGAPVAGAAVRVRTTGERATSDREGAFTLDVAANTTLTVAATAPDMAPTLLQQLILAPGARAAVEIPLIGSGRFGHLVAMGWNASGGVVAVALKSLSGAGNVAGATVELTPGLGRVMYAPISIGIPDPDPAIAATVAGKDAYAWVLGAQPHVATMQLALRGVAQVAPPYAIDDVILPGTFTVDAGALTLVTLFTR
jgi:hypothetical protein